jgi:hypothetical protein
MLIGLIRHDLHGDLAHANAIADIALKIAKRLRMQYVGRGLGNGPIMAREFDYAHACTAFPAWALIKASSAADMVTRSW